MFKLNLKNYISAAEDDVWVILPKIRHIEKINKIFWSNRVGMIDRRKSYVDI